jgi:hypothetical protein
MCARGTARGDVRCSQIPARGARRYRTLQSGRRTLDCGWYRCGPAAFPQRLRDDADALTRAAAEESRKSERQRMEQAMTWNDDLMAEVNDEHVVDALIARE